jgi:hypothetical protein
MLDKNVVLIVYVCLIGWCTGQHVTLILRYTVGVYGLLSTIVCYSARLLIVNQVWIAVTWISTNSVAGITSDMYDRRYHHSRTLLGPVSGLSDVYTTDTTTSI